MKAYYLTQTSSRSIACVTLSILLSLLATQLSAQIITTVAGSTLKGDGGPAISAALSTPTGVAIDGNGNLFIADQDNHRIRKVTPDGTISTVAGTGAYGYSGDNGPAINATLGSPSGIAVDATGNLFIADQNTHSIRKVATDGTITTVAGNGIAGFSGDTGPAVNANLHTPYAVAVDATGNLFIADQANHRIRKVAADGKITTVAGTGTQGYNSDNIQATAANLNTPSGITVDATGNLFIADALNHRIRKVATDGTISTVAGTGIQSFGGDAGPATNAQLANPTGVAVDASGQLFIADLANHRIRKVATDGTISTVAGTNTQGFSGDNGPATSAYLNNPSGITVDAAGQLFIADKTNYRIRKVATDGTISTVAGNGTPDFSGDNGPAINAALGSPSGVTIDGSGNLYIADKTNYRIRKVATNGTITTIAGNGLFGFSGDTGPAINAQLAGPTGVAVDANGNLFIADPDNNRIRKVTTDSKITTVAGNGTAGFSGDNNPAINAALNNPTSVALDGSGNLYIADRTNHRIRKVTPGGTISTVAGTGTAGFSGNNSPAVNAVLNNPTGVAVDESGNLYIADRDNHRIRKVTPDGTISTVAGNGTQGSGGDNGPAINANLNTPSGIAVDGNGNLFIDDTFNHRIRKVTSDGTISTVAGNGAPGKDGDNGPATSAQLNAPFGVALDGSGNLFIADQANNLIRRVSAPASVRINPSTSISACVGSSFSLTATAINFTPTSYTWTSQPSGLSASGASPVFTAPSVSTATTYTLTVTATDGTTNVTASVNVSVNPLPVPTLTASNPLNGTLTSATLTASGGTSYLFSGPGVVSQNSISGTAVANVSGTYSVTVTSIAGCSSTTSVALPGTDLSPTIDLPQANFPIGSTSNFLVNVFEVNGLPTSMNNVVITITAPTGYTLSFANSLTSIIVSGGSSTPVEVDNTKWTVTSMTSGVQLTLTINSGQFIAAKGKATLGFSLSRTTANSGSTSSITVNVKNDAAKTYDGNSTNNVYARIINGL
ncbi:NHL domain-containing protein [Spirosoma litoris]